MPRSAVPPVPFAVKAVLLGLILIPASLRAFTPPGSPPPEPRTAHFRYELLRYQDHVHEDGTQTVTEEARVQLLTAAAVDRFGQIGSTYIQDYGGVLFEEVLVRKPDGRLLDARNGVVEDLNPYADLRFKSLTLPGLQVGDTLSYKIVTRRIPLTPGRVFGEMKLTPAAGNPVQIYELDLPRDAGIRLRLREGLEDAWEDVPSPPDRLVRRLTHTPAVPRHEEEIDEGDIEAWAEPDVIYTNFLSWAEVASWWWNLSRDRLAFSPAMRDKALALTSGASSPREQLAALYRFVATEIRYEDVGLGVGHVRPRRAAEVLESLFGDCKDKHALLAALASSLGLEVLPALVNTVRSDLRDDVPAPQQFDHVVSVSILGEEPDEWLWMDTTNPYALPGYLSPGVRNKRVLLIEPDREGRIVRTPAQPPFAPRAEVAVTGTLQSDGVLDAHVVWRVRSDAETRLRAALAATPEADRPDLVSRLFAAEWGDGEVSSASSSDPSDFAEPLRLEFDASLQVLIAGPGLSQTFRLPLPDFSPPEASPGGLELESHQYVQRAEVALPEGVKVQPPIPVSQQRPYATYDSSYSGEQGRLTLERTLRLHSHVLTPEEIASYEAFTRAIEKDRAQPFSLTGLASLLPASAQALFSQGDSALQRRDFAAAVESLRRAAEIDPGLKDVFVKLGEAQSWAGRYDDALESLGRQIELDPFHEWAYSSRAFAFMRLNRWNEAEADLLKQVEVNPFNLWAYERLGQRRASQRRFEEAAEFYGRAAAIEPEKASVWIDLAWMLAWSGRAADARSAADRAAALSLSDRQRVQNANVYEIAGDPARAAEQATALLPSLAARLARLSPDNYAEGDLRTTDTLASTWYLLGASALAADRPDEAERYLLAAWEVAGRPRAGWALGDLREKQGRLAEAVVYWQAASRMPQADLMLPGDYETRIATALEKLPEAPPVNEMRAQRIDVGGEGELVVPVLVLMGRDGEIEQVQKIAGVDLTDFEEQLAALGSVGVVPFQPPDDLEFKMVRHGVIACSRTKRCQIALAPSRQLKYSSMQWEVSRSHSERWEAETRAVASGSHPLGGLWKIDDCDQDYGLAIGPMTDTTYYVSFCSFVGCASPGRYRPATPIVGDPDFTVVDEDTLELRGQGATLRYQRCTPSWRPPAGGDATSPSSGDPES